jgi:hypothetical protein
VVGDDQGNGERHCGVQPVPTACGEDYRACRGCTCCCGSVRDGVEKHCGHRQVVFVGLVLIVPAENERAASHHDCGYTAHDEHGQAVHLRYAMREPACRCSDDEHLQYEQPAAVDERGDARRPQGAIPPSLSGRTRGQRDRQQGHTHASGIEEIVATCCEHRQGMRRHTYRRQGAHQAQVQH